MNHVYIVNESTIASNYGIGTYIQQLVEYFYHDSFFSINIINLNTKNEKFELNYSKSIPIINIPYIGDLKSLSENKRYYRNVAYILRDHINIEETEKIIFHLNFPNHNLIYYIKYLFPNAKTIYTIHFDPAISLNDSYEKKTVKKNPLNRKKMI